MQNIFWLFPIIFMLHEIEEIIGFRIWLDKNINIVRKYNKLSMQYQNFSNEGLFSAAEIVLLKNAANLPCGKHRKIVCTFSFHCKSAVICNPRLLIKAAVVEFIGTESSDGKADKCLFSRCATCVYW